jgi:hypothetical protein
VRGYQVSKLRKAKVTKPGGLPQNSSPGSASPIHYFLNYQMVLVVLFSLTHTCLRENLGCQKRTFTRQRPGTVAQLQADFVIFGGRLIFFCIFAAGLVIYFAAAK